MVAGKPKHRLLGILITPSLADMGHGNGVSVARPRPCKFCRTLSSCWRWPRKKDQLSTFSRPTTGSSSYSAPLTYLIHHKSSRVFTPQRSAKKPVYGRDSRACANGTKDRKDRSENSQCEVGYCYRRRLPDTTYCKSHICHTNRCVDIRAIGSLHCVAHRCRSCSAKAKTRNSYCEAHKCRIPSCLRGKKSGQDWCSRHVCQWEDCTATPAKGTRYCGYHTCAAEDCVSKVLSNGNWVGDCCCCHTCSADGCLLRVASTGTFCAGHECLILGCPNPRLWDGKNRGGLGGERGCCRFHTCVQRGCFAPTAKVGAFCDLHAQSCSGWQSPRICHLKGQALRSCVGNHRHRKSRSVRGDNLAKGDVERLDSVDFQSFPIGMLCSVM
ncbi:hypothetical protein F5B21DRAFT_490896 [Xylaria acuta]|nr:hypothetical protein F5B21DRAFT_490896 [Xylaria acuta]